MFQNRRYKTKRKQLQMQESNILNQNAKRVAVKVLVKDDMPIFLQQETPIFPKNTYYSLEHPKNDYLIYDQVNKNVTQKCPKTLQESMFSLCQQYSNSVQLFPYLNYYHPSLLGNLAMQQTDEITLENREEEPN